MADKENRPGTNNFASEHILQNLTIAVLHTFNKIYREWSVRDLIFTDKAVYVFE
jgi:hypothetical protein